MCEQPGLVQATQAIVHWLEGTTVISHLLLVKPEAMRETLL